MGPEWEGRPDLGRCCRRTPEVLIPNSIRRLPTNARICLVHSSFQFTVPTEIRTLPRLSLTEPPFLDLPSLTYPMSRYQLAPTPRVDNLALDVSEDVLRGISHKEHSETASSSSSYSPYAYPIEMKPNVHGQGESIEPLLHNYGLNFQ